MTTLEFGDDVAVFYILGGPGAGGYYDHLLCMRSVSINVLT
jgi:hypothetical protein